MAMHADYKMLMYKCFYPPSHVSSSHIPDSALHPQLRILLMRPQKKPLHGRTLAFAQALVSYTLETELRVPFVYVDFSGDLKQAV